MRYAQALFFIKILFIEVILRSIIFKILNNFLIDKERTLRSTIKIKDFQYKAHKKRPFKTFLHI